MLMTTSLYRRVVLCVLSPMSSLQVIPHRSPQGATRIPQRVALWEIRNGRKGTSIELRLMGYLKKES